MSKWSKKTFIEHLNQSCESDVAMHCIELVDFSEKISDEVSWGSGEDFGTMTFSNKSSGCPVYPSSYPNTCIGLIIESPSLSIGTLSLIHI